MSEILYFEIPAFYQNNQPLPNASCTFIVGSQSIESPVPTQNLIKIKTENLNGSESLLILFKQNDDIVAKVTSTLRALRNNTSLDSSLEGLKKVDGNNKNNIYSWSHSYYILQEETKRENPFTGNVLITPGSTLKEEDLKLHMHESAHKESPVKQGTTNQSGFEDKLPSFDAEGKGNSGSPTKTGHELPAKVKADFYLSLMEAKLESAVKADSALSPEINHILNNLKLSIEEISKAKAVEAANPILPHHSIHETSGSENFSPKFGKEQFAYPGPSSDELSGRKGEADDYSPFGTRPLSASRFQAGITLNSTGPAKEMMSWRVEEEVKVVDDGENFGEINANDEAQETAKEKDDEAGLFLQQMEGDGNESSEEGSYSQSAGSRDSLEEEVQIDRNQDFLIEVKNMLNIKTLSNVTDDFTRELVMQMAKGKKKVVAVRLKRAIKLRNKEEIEVENKSYFREGCGKQILHFFQPYTKYLCLFNLTRHFDVMEEKCNQISLEIDFDISPHYKSIITPSGLIFIVSGKTQPASPDLDDSTGSLHVYNYNGRTLVEKPSMSVQRVKNFGLCYMSKNLFVVGGIVNGIISNYCERFDVRSNEWLELAPMNKKLKDVSVCAFNNRYVYRFFGVNANNQVDNSIERYDAVRDKWVLMNITVPESLRGTYMPLCTQIHQDYIFLFGGRTSSGYPTKNSKGYALKIEDKRRSTGGKISETKSFVAGLAGNFSQNNMIAHNGDILFLRESY